MGLHVDPDLDVTTAFRFHFVEVALSAGFRIVQVLAIGPSQRTYFAEAGSIAISVPPLLVKDFSFSSVAPGI